MGGAQYNQLGTLTASVNTNVLSNQITGFTLATPVPMTSATPTSLGVSNAILYSLDGSHFYPWPILDSGNQVNLNGNIVSYAIYDTLKFGTTLSFKIVMWPGTWPFNLIGAANLQHLTASSVSTKKGVSMINYMGSKTYGTKFCLPLLPGLQMHAKTKYL